MGKEGNKPARALSPSRNPVKGKVLGSISHGEQVTVAGQGHLERPWGWHRSLQCSSEGGQDSPPSPAAGCSPASPRAAQQAPLHPNHPFQPQIEM